MLTLQKPDSKKFKDRLTDYTAAVAAKMKKPWTQCIHPRLVEVLLGHMQDSKAAATGDSDKKKDKKEKEKKEKGKKEKKEKKSKA